MSICQYFMWTNCPVQVLQNSTSNTSVRLSYYAAILNAFPTGEGYLLATSPSWKTEGENSQHLTYPYPHSWWTNEKQQQDKNRDYTKTFKLWLQAFFSLLCRKKTHSEPETINKERLNWTSSQPKTKGCFFWLGAGIAKIFEKKAASNIATHGKHWISKCCNERFEHRVQQNERIINMKWETKPTFVLQRKKKLLLWMKV